MPLLPAFILSCFFYYIYWATEVQKAGWQSGINADNKWYNTSILREISRNTKEREKCDWN